MLLHHLEQTKLAQVRDLGGLATRRMAHDISRQQCAARSGYATKASAHSSVRRDDARSAAFSSSITWCRLRMEEPPLSTTFSCDVAPTTNTNRAGGSPARIRPSYVSGATFQVGRTRSLGDFRGVLFENTSFGHTPAEAGFSIGRRLQRRLMPRKPTSSARQGVGDKRRGHSFAAVEAIGRALPDVEVTTAWGQPAVCARETAPHSSRRSSGSRGRRAPLRQRPDAGQVGHRQPPRHGSAITRSR
jgi:hypothetical protein